MVMTVHVPDSLTTIALDKLYRHSYCLVDKKYTNTIKSILTSIENHESYSKYKVLQETNGHNIKITLVGKPSYSF